jgi:hypothetical protein
MMEMTLGQHLLLLTSVVLLFAFNYRDAIAYGTKQQSKRLSV